MRSGVNRKEPEREREREKKGRRMDATTAL
jgi:hypothetical protein